MPTVDDQTGLLSPVVEAVRRAPSHITNSSEAKARLSSPIDPVLAGHDVVIGEAGKPVVRLVPFERSKEDRRPGALRGKIRIADDFDDLPEPMIRRPGSPAPGTSTTTP